MRPEAFSAAGTFWRGNLHTHSNRSDGVLEPEEVCRRYRAEGYDFISLTDHFVGLWNYPLVDTTAFRDERFTTLLGAELHSGAMENGELWHIVAAGLPADFAPSNSPHFMPVEDQETGPEIARRAVEAGAFVAIAHPEWSGLSLGDARSIDVAHAVEVYNHSCAVGADRPHGFWHLDRLLEEDRHLNLIATDDAHFSEPDHFGGWVMVKAEENEPAALLEALKAGHMYSSSGPEIHDLVVEQKELHIECSAASAIIVSAEGTAAFAHHGSSITRATLKLGRLSGCPWLRVTVVDAAGCRAWTNPIWR